MAEKAQLKDRPKVTGPAILKDDIDKLEAGPDTVTVACKLPNGLILRVFDATEMDEPILGGGVRRTQIYRPRPDTVIINGNSAPVNPSGAPAPFTIIDANRRGDGFGLTHNVPRDFFVLWMKQNKDAPYVKEGLIWAYSDLGEISAKARDLENVKSGLEPLDPDGDYRAPKQIQPFSKTA